jgi:hypothetical protein
MDKIQQKAMQIIIAKCGFNRKTHRSIIYGPISLGGAAFRHLYTKQGVGQIHFFLKHWQTPTTQSGKLIRIALKWAQYGVGTAAILTDVNTHLPHMEVL